MLQLIVTVLLCVAGLAAGFAAAYYFLRARREEAAAPDPTDTIVEMRALGQRIETLVGQQQLQGETARHQMAQKMEAVVENVNQQRTHVAGLQNELRHEVRRRDAEMDEIRHQLTSIQQMATRPALPAAPAAALPPAAEQVPPTHAEPQAAEPQAAEPQAAEPAVAEQTPVAEPADTFEIAAFEPVAPAEPVAAFAPVVPAEPTGDGFAASFSDDGWDVGVTPAATPPAAEVPAFADPFAFDPPPAQAPLPAPASSFDGAPGVTFEDVTPEMSAAPEAPAAVPAFGTPVFEVPTFETPTFEMDDSDSGSPAFETPAFETPAFETPIFDAPTFETQTFTTSTFQAPAFETPAFTQAAPAAPGSAIAAPPSETAWVARADRPEPASTFPTFDVPTFDAPAAEAPASPDPTAPFVAPAGADRLTVISSIDEPTQQALYVAGVTTLDEIARWSRTDARRISSLVAVSEDAILNQWVFEAQAALFQSFSSAPR